MWLCGVVFRMVLTLTLNVWEPLAELVHPVREGGQWGGHDERTTHFLGSEVCDEGDDELEQARCGAARELQEEAGISLSAETLLTFSHWLTPVVVKSRFSTWFFIAEVGSDDVVTVDGSEIVAHE